MKVPDFVVKNGYGKIDWIENDDRLINVQNNLPSNEEKWWLTNVKIRRCLMEIEDQIKIGRDSKVKLSLHLISYNNISKMTGISRVSISHQRRNEWISKQLIRLKKEVLNSKRPIVQEEKILLILKKQVIEARTETFVWFNKVLNLEQEKLSLEKVISTLKKALNAKNRTDNSRFLS